MMTKEKEYVIINKKTEYCKSIYTVKKPPESDWPKDSEMLEWCDSPFGAPFGGKVEKHNNVALVTVYTD